MSEQVTVATANTHEARMLRDPKGLASFVEGGVDVLLMQEVLDLTQDSLEARLKTDNYTLAHFEQTSGLAIAVRSDSGLHVQEDSVRTEVLKPAEKIGKLASSLGVNMSNRLRTRSLIAVKLETPEHNVITVASTHPIVFIRALGRARQVKEIGKVLTNPYYQTDPLIVAGDMNHYPGPRKVDLDMRLASGLSSVELDEPTWRVRGSKHHWAAAIGARLTRRELENFDGELDAILYRSPDDSLHEISSEVVDAVSDHDAIIATLSLSSPKQNLQ